MYKRALDIKRVSDGEHHFSVGHTLYNLACLHMDHGKLSDAAELMQQVRPRSQRSTFGVPRSGVSMPRASFEEDLGTLMVLEGRQNHFFLFVTPLLKISISISRLLSLCSQPFSICTDAG